MGPVLKVALTGGELAISETQASNSLDIPIHELVLKQYDAEHRALRRYLAYLGIGESNAQEIVQETFLKLHLHLLGKGNRKNLKAWLYRVAHNLARNQQSSSWVRLTTSIDTPQSGEAPEQHSSATPESLLLDRERELRFRRALDSLSHAQRACLALRAEGFKYREIADVLELSTSTVGENVQRGLEKLKELL
jgi:RNA polymerase sigma-70 factor, ECF subfamily